MMLDDKTGRGNILHNQLKNFFLIGIEKYLESLGDARITSYDQIKNGEYERQWLAFERAQEKWQKQIGIPELHGRSEKAMRLMKEMYFTIMTQDMNWSMFTPFFLDEYYKIKNGRSKI